MFLKCKVVGPSLQSKDEVFGVNSIQRKDGRFQKSEISASAGRADTLPSLQLLCDCILTGLNRWILRLVCDEGKQKDSDWAMREMSREILRESNDRDPVAVLLSMLQHGDQLMINRIRLAHVG